MLHFLEQEKMYIFMYKISRLWYESGLKTQEKK